MRKSKLALLTFLIISITLFLSGCSSTPTNQSPNASFHANPISGEAPLEVSFDASNSSDPDGSIISYDWEFGDGSTGSGKTVSNTYQNEGSYQVVLTVRDDGGLSDSESITISVGGDTPTTNQPPEVGFSCTGRHIPVGDDWVLECDASASTDPDGTIVEYNWLIKSFSLNGTLYDIASKGSKVIRHEPTVIPSDNEVRLEIKDDDGSTDVQTKSYTIGE